MKQKAIALHLIEDARTHPLAHVKRTPQLKPDPYEIFHSNTQRRSFLSYEMHVLSYDVSESYTSIWYSEIETVMV